MALELCDTHAHLDYPEFAHELDLVVQRARDVGVTKIMSVGTDEASSRRALALADSNPAIHAVVGWHPNHANEAPDDVRPVLRELARANRTAAIGETGLDYYRLPSSQNLGTEYDDRRFKRKQAAVFEQHLEVAQELGLSVVIHQRAAWADTVAMLKPYAGKLQAVFHCFSEPLTALQEILDLGFMVSFTGILTFKNGQGVRDALSATPNDSFMVETDCPYLAPVPYRGKRCEPAYVRHTAETAAQVKGIGIEELGNLTTNNARRFFRGLNS